MNEIGSDFDRKMMRRALELADKGAGWTAPNPLVGAVVCQGEEIIGEGYHPRIGESHAEPIALDQAGERAKGGTLYVNLEPCAHYGRTPPCLDRILLSGVSRVVIPFEDPDPRTSGKSVRTLKEKGVEVTVGVCEEEARKANHHFLSRNLRKRPWVTLKYAMTLDGRIATSTGDSKWIANEESREFVHDLRRRHRSILVGYRTYSQDNPMLSSRIETDPPPRQPLRIVYGGDKGIDRKSQLALNANVIPVLQVVSSQVSVHNPEGVVTLRLDHRDLTAKEAVDKFLAYLQEIEIDSLFVEGGAHTLTTFLEAGVVDEVYVFIAPKILNEKLAVSPFMGQGIKPSISEGLTLHEVESREFQGDILIHGYFTRL